MHKRGVCCRAVSVRLSVCLPRSWVASKRIKISSKFFNHRILCTSTSEAAVTGNKNCAVGMLKPTIQTNTKHRAASLRQLSFLFLPATPRIGRGRYSFEAITVSVCLHGICLQIVNSFNVSGINEATLFKFGSWIEYGRVHPGVKNFSWKGRGLGHVTLLKFFNPFQYFWNGWSHTLSIWQVDRLWQVPPKVKNFFPKGAWTGPRDLFWNFKPPSIFLEWMRLRCLNLFGKWIDYGKSHPRGKKNFFPKGAWSGLPDRFGDKAMLSTLL